MSIAQITNPRFERQQSDWLASQLAPLAALQHPIIQAHKKARDSGEAISRANEIVRHAVSDLIHRQSATVQGVNLHAVLSADASDEEIKEYAQRRASDCETIVFRAEFPALAVAFYLQECGLSSDLITTKRNPDGAPIANPWEARVSDPRWWRRQLRSLLYRRAEQWARENRLTHRRAGAYVCDFTYGRWLHRQRRNAILLESITATNEEGEQYTLAELAALSTSNPINRRGELMLRARGMGEWAEADSGDWRALFFTITCPSKYHCTLEHGHENPKYNGTTPREAANYLQELWTRARAKLARQKVEYFGVRVAEPHHDGTPHWHLLLFVREAHAETLTTTLQAHALRDDGTEPGAKKHRFQCVELDNPASAASYIAKYVSKNIDGHAVGGDDEAGMDSHDSAPRVRAWASVWGIRQFQQLQGPPVTVYRELRRAANNPERQPPDCAKPEQLSLLIDAADNGDWQEYMRRMGGAVCPRKARPAWTLYSEKDLKNLTVQFGRYGEPVRRVVGIIGKDFLLISRFRKWLVERTNKTDHAPHPPAPRARRNLCPLNFITGARIAPVISRADRPSRLKDFVLLSFPRPPPAGALDSCQ